MEQEVYEVLTRLEKYNRQQSRAARLQCVISVISMLCCVAALVTVMHLVPKIDKMTSRTESFIATAEDVLEDVQTVSGKLSEMDMGPVLLEVKNLLEHVDGLLANVDELVVNVDTLVATTQDGLEDTLEKIEKVDFDKLNKAISDLSAVIDPLARFFSNFNRS